MATFTETKETLDIIARRFVDNVNLDISAYRNLLIAQQDLSDMQTTYAAFSAQLDTDAAANPTDIAWQTAKAEKDQMVSDFVTEKNRVDALITAYKSV